MYKPLGIRRPAGAVFELLRAIALHQQEAAGLQRALEIGEKRGPLGRATTKMKIAATTSNAFAGQRQVKTSVTSVRSRTPRSAASACALASAAGEKSIVEHVEALLGEPHAVAAFAVGDRQRGPAGGQPMALALLRKAFGSLPKMIVRRAKSRLPSFQFGHVG